jgi:hypothetical protein
VEDESNSNFIEGSVDAALFPCFSQHIRFSSEVFYFAHHLVNKFVELVKDVDNLEIYQKVEISMSVVPISFLHNIVNVQGWNTLLSLYSKCDVPGTMYCKFHEVIWIAYDKLRLFNVSQMSHGLVFVGNFASEIKMMSAAIGHYQPLYTHIILSKLWSALRHLLIPQIPKLSLSIGIVTIGVQELKHDQQLHTSLKYAVFVASKVLTKLISYYDINFSILCANLAYKKEAISWKVCLPLEVAKCNSISQEAYIVAMLYLYHDNCYEEVHMRYDFTLLVDWFYENFGPLSVATLKHRKDHGFLPQVTHNGWMSCQKIWYGLCYIGDTLIKVVVLHNPQQSLFYVGDALVTVVISCRNLYEIANKSLSNQDGPYTYAYFVGLLLQWLDKFKWSNSLCGIVFEVNQGEVAAFHSYAITTLATFLHIVTNVATRSRISKFCVGPSALSELTYNVVGIKLNFANGYDIALHGIASLFKIHHGFIKNCGLIGSVFSMLLVANIVLYGYVQEVLVRLNSTLDMLLQSDVVKYEFFGQMCDLQGIAGQEADGSLHFTCEQWDPGGYLDLNMSTIVRFSQFKQWYPGKFMAEAGFYNLEDKVGLEGVSNDRILE